MHQLLQQIFSGLAAGAIYASLALALVMIYRATDLVNFAQGEMAMFSTYIAWTLVNAGFPFWGAFVITLFASFVGGMAIERIVIRPVENAPILTAVVVTIGLLLIFNALAGWIYSYTLQEFPSPFPDRILFGALMTTRDVGVIVVTPVLFLDPHMMSGVLLSAFTGALLGGITSPVGAVIGGLLVGVTENLVGTYLIASQLKLTVALLLIILVLVFRPNGLFGTAIVRRV